MFQIQRVNVVASFLIAFVLLSTAVAAQSTKVEGLIKARNGDTMVLQVSGSPLPCY
jgi:hypothetical protein